MKRKSQTVNPSHNRRGLSLVEVSVCALIVGLMITTAMKCVGGVFTTSVGASTQYDAMQLADQLIDEIVQHHYEEPIDTPSFGIEGSESTNRSIWDDVDDYHNLSNSPPEDRTGLALVGADGWTRSVSVRLVQLSDPTQTASIDEGLKEITVTASHANGISVVRKVLRSKHGLLENDSFVDSTWVTATEIKMTTGTQTVYGAASLANSSEDQ